MASLRALVIFLGGPIAIGGLLGIGLVSDMNGPSPTAPSTIMGRAGPSLQIRAPALHAIPDGADCLAHLSSRGAIPAPEPTSSLGTADNSSAIVTLDHLPGLGGGDGSAGPYVPAVRDWGRSHLDVFAGLFLANGHLYVGLAKDPVQNLAIIRGLVDRPQLIRAVAATYSLAAITVSMELLDHDQRALEERGIHLTVWGPDEYHNRLNVGVREIGPEVAAYLRRHYGGPMVNVTQGVYACPV